MDTFAPDEKPCLEILMLGSLLKALISSFPSGEDKEFITIAFALLPLGVTPNRIFGIFYKPLINMATAVGQTISQTIT